MSCFVSSQNGTLTQQDSATLCTEYPRVAWSDFRLRNVFPGLCVATSARQENVPAPHALSGLAHLEAPVARIRVPGPLFALGLFL